jgi:FKBP-type peptidyl-prolyl cis-trans isomerase FkpA/FKBP-type peptidyl-prolyl cis-trans isomerase FklB
LLKDSFLKKNLLKAKALPRFRQSFFALFSSLTGIALLTACQHGGGIREDVTLDTDKKKAGYAIGQGLGQSLKDQGVEVDVNMIAVSIKDVLEGRKRRLDWEELRAARMKIREQRMAKGKEERESNKKEGEAFLEENKGKEGVKVTDSGLQYKVLEEGDGKSPSVEDTVRVHYKGTLINGETFDSSYERGEPVEFPLSGTIKGFTEGLQLMKVGGKWKFFVPANLAYGEINHQGIPPNATLIFEVELLEIVSEADSK